MVRHTHVFPVTSKSIPFTRTRFRSGGGRRGPARKHDRQARAHDTGGYASTLHGSHMPLDTTLHWRWNNPLNVLPLMLAITVVLALVGLIV